MNKIRFGILGSGFMGRTHIEAIRRLPNAEVVAVTGGTRAPGLAERYRIACEPDDAALLRRRDIDAVIVTTPHHCHVDQTLAAAAQGKHVLVEKPLATSAEDCDRMIEATTRAKVNLSVGYQQRFRVNNAKAHELIRSGAIGRVITAQISMPMYAGTIKAGGFGGNWAWWNDPRSRAHLLNSSPHGLDMIRWFTGAEIVTVTALSRTFLPDVPVEDTTIGLFALSSGAIGSLYSSRALPAPSFPGEEFRFRIVGTTGLIDLDAYTELKMSDEANGWQVMSRQPPVNHEGADTAFADVRMQAYRDQMAAFIDAIEGRPSVVGSAEDGRAAVAACVGMLEASAQRRWIDLAPQG